MAGRCCSATCRPVGAYLRLGELVTQGCVAALLALGCIRSPLRGCIRAPTSSLRPHPVRHWRTMLFQRERDSLRHLAELFEGVEELGVGDGAGAAAFLIDALIDVGLKLLEVGVPEFVALFQRRGFERADRAEADA